MSTTTVQVKPPTFLSKVGADFKKVFAFLGTPKVQSAIVAGEALGEGIAHAFNPGLAVFDPLISNWTQEIFKAEALAAAAGQQSGSGPQKAAMVLNTLTPQVVTFAEQNGLAIPTGNNLNLANSLLVQFLQVFKPADTTVASATANQSFTTTSAAPAPALTPSVGTQVSSGSIL